MYCHGLDLCKPMCQVYCGVRVGGLQMSLKHSQNKSIPHFPHDYPDCPAGVRFQEQQEIELLEKFKRCKKTFNPCSFFNILFINVELL